MEKFSGATFSEDKLYRYALWRTWDNTEWPLCFLMLNPSTADEVKNDPTVERCERRARMMGFGGLRVANIFAFRATDPRDMKAALDPVGPENDAHILRAASESGMVIAAWGNHGAYRGRSTAVRKLLHGVGAKLHYLRLGKTGEPGHPLYIGYDVQPQEWKFIP